MGEIGLFLAGAAITGIVACIIFVLAHKSARKATDELLEQTRTRHDEALATMREGMRHEFSTLSRDALRANTEDFLKQAGTALAGEMARGRQALEEKLNVGNLTLEEKKKLIDQTLVEMTSKLKTISEQFESAERRRSTIDGEIKQKLDNTVQVTGRLQETTSQLHKALANPQARGQWGERMAEDVLRLAGFVEGINYRKQTRTADGTRPDFEFPLPGDRKVYMDVKFPLNNYMKMLEQSDEAERSRCDDGFLKDVRRRVSEVTNRNYIDPVAGTLDYVLVFIPNEHMYSFIHDRDRSLLDYALSMKVVLCSPLTLYAILAVIRQGIENFNMDRKTTEVLNLLGEVRKQWENYTASMEKMGKKLTEALGEYNHLTTTRERTLDAQFRKIDRLADDRAELPQLESEPATSK